MFNSKFKDTVRPKEYLDSPLEFQVIDRDDLKADPDIILIGEPKPVAGMAAKAPGISFVVRKAIRNRFKTSTIVSVQSDNNATPATLAVISLNDKNGTPRSMEHWRGNAVFTTLKIVDWVEQVKQTMVLS